MATPSNAIVPELLTKDNYRKWRVWMRHYFVAQDLWDVVDPKGSAEAITKEWIKKNALAMYAITTSCGEEIFYRIETVDKARDAWNKLAEEAVLTFHNLVVEPVKTGRGEMSNEIEEEMNPTNDAPNKLVHDGLTRSLAANPVERETENKWKGSFLDMVLKGKCKASHFDRFFRNHPTAKTCTALQVLATTAGQSSGYLKKAIKAYKYLISKIDKLEYLLDKDERGNTLLSNAVRHGKESMIKLLIEKNKKLLAKEQKSCKDNFCLLLTTVTDADGKIPVQLACESGNKVILKLVYIETPSNFLHPDNGEYGFQLIKDCISKKMFDIALHLLYQIPKLTFYRSSSDGTSVLLTMSQFPQSPFFPEHRLSFWKRWSYHCINFDVKFKPSTESADEIGFEVDARIFGRRRNWSILKADEVQAEQVVQAADQQQHDDEKADEQLTDDEANSLVGETTSNLRVDQMVDVEANCQAVQHVDQPHEDCDDGVGLQAKIGFINLLKELGFKWVFIITGLELLIKMIILPLVSVLRFLGILKRLIGFDKTYELKLNHVYFNQILNLISERLKGLGTKELAQNGAIEATFLAIRNHIPEIVMEFTKANQNVLSQYFDHDDFERNVLAMTVMSRQEKVAKYLCEFDINDIKHATTITDKDGNNMLHLAAKLAPPAQLAHISGAALQLQSELRWFKEVESIVPSFQKDSKNKNKKTPSELFASEHESLMKEAEGWLKKAAESSTVVGALIITIMFAAAFTIPGGNNQDTGFPIFSHKLPFLIFIIADAISLFAAITSVLMFLAILTSRYALEDFSKSLPVKLILGLSSLFISIAAMIVAFCAALFVILQGRLVVVVPITLLAVIPVTSFVLLQFPLLVEILQSTYSSDIFKKKKRRGIFQLLFCSCVTLETIREMKEDEFW